MARLVAFFRPPRVFSIGVRMNVANTRLKALQHAIERGERLVLAGLPCNLVEEIEEQVKQHLRNAEIAGTEPTIPAFP